MPRGIRRVFLNESGLQNGKRRFEKNKKIEKLLARAESSGRMILRCDQMDWAALMAQTSLSEDKVRGTLKKLIPSSCIVFSSCLVLTPRMFLGSEAP